MERACGKPGCYENAIHTLTLDYREQVAVVGPLSPSYDPTALDLCTVHAGRFTAPQGWELVRYRDVAEGR